MSDASLSVQYVGARRWRPPKVELRFDVAVHNEDAAARWALLPDKLDTRATGDEPVHAASIEVYELAGTGRAVAVHVLGERGRLAFLLAPDAELALAGLPISFWGEPPERADVELTFASAVRVEGVPIEDVIQTDLLCDAGARVDAAPLANQAAVVEVIPGPGRGPVRVDWDAARTTRQRVELTGGPAG